MKMDLAVELVSIAEIKRFSAKKLAVLLTPHELAYCQRQKKRASEHIAARLAAKRALCKIIKVNNWQNLEIRKDLNGKPLLQLRGPELKAFEKKKFKNILLSLSHTQEEAIASLIVT